MNKEEILAHYDNLGPRAKSALQRLRSESWQNHPCERDLAITLRAVQIELRREELMAGLDPVLRIVADPIKRIALNAIARSLCEARLSPEQALVIKALGEGSTPGSTYIREELDAELFNLLATAGAWRTLGVRPMISRTKKFPILTTRPTARVIYADGIALPDDSAAAGTSVSGDAAVIGVLVNISTRLAEDMGADLSVELIQAFVEAMSYRFDYIAFSGNGATDADNGGFVGIFDSASGAATATASAGNDTILELDTADFERAVGALDSGALERKCRWWINSSNLYKFMALRDGSGSPLLKSVLDTGGETLFSILGYPVTLTAAAPSTDAAGSPVAAFGHGPSYAVGLREDFGWETTNHFRWDYYQRTLRALSRATFAMRRPLGFVILKTAAS